MAQAKPISDRTILVTGIISWLLLAFASTKLAVIYARYPNLAYLLAYNISSVVFLLYFIGYFKQRFGVMYLLLLLGAYNIGIHILEFIYDRLFLIYTSPFDLRRALAATILNVVIMFITWGILYLFIRKRK